MTATAILFDDLTVLVDRRTALVGGSFEGFIAYAPDPLKWVCDYLRQCDNPVLIDVGACTGSYSLLAAHIPELQVFAFEPVPLLYTLLQNNITLNVLENRINAQPVAVGAETRKAVLHIVEPDTQIALSYIDGKPVLDKMWVDESVMMICLDDLVFPDRISLIKIDTEGSELHVLQGAVKLIERDHPALLIEAIPQNCNVYGYNPDSIEVLLQTWDYTWEYINGVDIAAQWQGDIKHGSTTLSSST